MRKQIVSRDPKDSRPAIVMAQDEGRFGRISDPRRCWAPHPAFAQKRLARSS
ncbi:MAG: hypothetical protein ACLQO6_19955 [Desulfomonilaceae bacterium]